MIDRRSLLGAALVTGAAMAQTAASSLEPAPVPRPAPDLEIRMTQGQPIRLSQYRGKVVLIEFLFTTCPHCQHEAQLLSRLAKEYEPKGLQVLGVAFNEMAVMFVPEFIQQNHVTFPVGYANRDVALRALGFHPDLRVSVPQVMLVDRKGVIQAQTPPPSDIKFTQEANLREMIEKLLVPSPTSLRPAVRKRPASLSSLLR